MKVKELIKKLEKCDQDATVCVYNEFEESDMYVKTVKEMVYHSEGKHEPYGIYDESREECLYCKRYTAIKEEDMEKLVVLFDGYWVYEENEEEMFDRPFKVGDIVVPAEGVNLDLPENTNKLTIYQINKNGTVDITIDTDDDCNEDRFVWKWRLDCVNPKDIKLAGEKDDGKI